MLSSMSGADTHDIVILGGGPAGAAAAKTAAAAGDARVADRQGALSSRDKLCGGLFTGRALTEYRRIFPA